MTSDRPGKITFGHLVSLGSRLTDRDHQIALDCYDHHVLTTEQLLRLHFAGLRTATARLDALYKLRVLDRFRPPAKRGTGSTPYHWILDEAGALIVADHLNIDRAKLGWQHSIAASIVHSQKLPHHVEVNEFFTRLAVEANTAGGALSEWYGERTCHHIFSGSLVADGYGVLDVPGRAPLHFLVELDRGTETTGRLREKAKAYASILPTSSLGKLDPLVLLLVPNTRRAETVREALAYSPAPIAVTVWSKDSTSAVLAIVANARERVRQSQQAVAREGLRSGAGSDLLGRSKDDGER